MARVLGTVTLSTTGLARTFNLGMASAPTWATLTVCEKSGTDNASHTSTGKVVGTYQFCQSTFSDATGSDSFNSSAHLVQHYERVGGVITKVLSASFNSFYTNGIKLDVDLHNTSYQVLIEAGN